MNQTNRLHLLLLAFVIVVFIWSVINVQDTYLTWVLEAAPVIIALPILLFTYKKFKFPTSLYCHYRHSHGTFACRCTLFLCQSAPW